MDDNKTNPDGNQQPLNPQNPSRAPNNGFGQIEEIPSIPDTSSPSQLPAEEKQVVFESVPVEEVSDQVESATPDEVTASTVTPSVPPPAPYEDNKHKFLILGGVIVFFVLVLVGILSIVFRGRGSPQPVTLTYWGLWEDENIMKPMIDKYVSRNKHVTIKYVKMSPQDSYREKLIARSQNGQGPDIFRYHNTWLPQLTQIAAYLPSSVMSNSEFEQTFYPIHQKDVKKDNYYYGIPLYIDGLVLIYNETWLKNSGISTAPTTWDDILDISNKLNPTKDADGNLSTGAIALGTANNIEHFSDILGLMLLQNGADLTTLTSPEAAGALETYRFFAEGDNPYWDDNMPDSINAFVQEKVAMIMAPSWQILTIQKANPDIRIKVVPVPVVPGSGSKRVSIANYWVEGVSRFSLNQIEAWKFLKFLSEKENLTLMYENQSKVRLFGSAYSRVDMASLLAQNNYLGAVIKQAQEDSYRSLPLIDRTYDKGLNDGIIQYLRNAVNATAEGASYTDALNTAKQGIDSLFAQYQIQ